MNKGQSLGIQNLDIQRAFDEVPHQILLKKLSCHVVGANVKFQPRGSAACDTSFMHYNYVTLAQFC